MSSFAAQNLQLKKAVILYDPDFSYIFTSSFRKNFQKQGGRILKSKKYNTQNPQIIAHLEVLLKDKPDLIVFPSRNITEINKVMKYMGSVDKKTVLLGSSELHNPLLLHQAGENKITSYYNMQFNMKAAQNIESQNFIAQFIAERKRYPSSLAAMYYDAFITATYSFKKSWYNTSKRTH